MAGAKPAAATVTAAPKTKTVHEFVLFRREGDARVPLMSDHELDVVHRSRVAAISGALAAGQARPDLFIVDRKCTYPVSSSGKLLAEGSTCDESEV